MLLFAKSSELMKMSGEKSEASDLIDEIVGNSPSETKTVISGRTTTEFVDDDERVGRCGLENERRLEHLGHERRHAFELRVVGADSCQYAVDYADFSARCWHVAAQLRHKRQHSNLQ